MALLGAISLLILALDGLHFFLRDEFTGPFELKNAVTGAILEQPLVSHTIELIVARLESWLTGLGVRADLVLYPHWQHAFVLLSLALVGYAHVVRDFAARPSTSAFRYVSALACALLGGLMVGTAHLGHPGVIGFPLVSLFAFLGVNSIWRCIVEREPAARIDAGMRAILWLGAAALIAFVMLDIGHAKKFTDGSSTPALIIIALMGAGIGLAGGLARGTAGSLSTKSMRQPGSRWLENTGPRLGLRVVAMLGLAGMLAAFGQSDWRMSHEANAADAASPGAVFRDCPQCPDMVAIPAGSFVMGTTQAQVEQLQAAQAWNQDLYGDELPARKVAVGAFALSRTEVTVAEFEAFLKATGYRPGARCWGLRNGLLDFHRHANWRDPGYPQNADHPVVCVSWRDAQAYVRWLSLHTGEAYQLPTEAQWEYAARAGTQTHYVWGDDGEGSCAFLNGADEQARLLFPEWKTLGCNDGASFTASVASYAPNAFGLFDMTGNVWEWVEDCYGPHDPAQHGPAQLDRAKTSAAAQTPTCSDRVIRGGSWSYGAPALRSANREPHHPRTRGSGVGFRIAKTL